MINDVTLQWIANHADKKGLDRFVDSQYAKHRMKKPKPAEATPEEIQEGWAKMKGFLGGKLN